MDYPGKVISKNAVVPSQTSASGVWTLDDAAAAVESNTWPIAGVPNPISRSLRFNSADSAYLNRTFSTPTDGKKWTLSFWMKRSALGRMNIFGYNGATNEGSIDFDSGNTLYINPRVGTVGGAGTNYFLQTTQVFRDVSAWYHIIYALDTTQATASNRVKLYVNGTQVTAFSTTNYPPQNSTPIMGSAVSHSIGRIGEPSYEFYFGGYFTEFNFIDGQALTPSDFGMTDPQTGAWIPKAYTGTYGTNGFYLNFSDNASTAALGTDYSGNNNTWTTNNFSVTAGAGNDSMTDVPTPWWPYNTTGDVGGVVRGNYATWNPLAKSDNHTVSNGNLDISSSGGTSYGAICATMGASSGKWYWEMLYNRSSASNSPVVGFGNDLFNYRNPPFGYLGSDLNAGGINVISGTAQINGTSTAYGSAIATNDVVMFAMDLDNRKFYIGKNGTWFNSGDPVAGTNSWPYSGTIVGSTFFPAANIFDNSAQTNFGQRPFAYTPPAGFLSLCTTNLPTPTILDGGEYFNTVLYTGTGSNRSVTGVGFQPDWVWVKDRTVANSPQLSDSVRGFASDKGLQTTNTLAEGVNSQLYGYISAALSDGFSVAAGTDPSNGSAAVNASGDNYVAWNWKANGTPAVTNTDGTITSSISVNTTSGFSIVTYTGTGANATVGHGLGVAPSWMVVKRRTGSSIDDWLHYHVSLGATKSIAFDNNAAITSSTRWNDTAPSSTVLTIGTSTGVNASGSPYVAYCFAAIPGYSAFGSYTGNGSADGPFVYTGFRPAFVMWKNASAAEGWLIEDAARSPYNQVALELYPSSSAAEAAGSSRSPTQQFDFLSNGFKVRGAQEQTNGSGNTIIYAAFAENPFKYSNAR